MNIVLLGASGSGKSLIEKELVKHCRYNKVISYTTRKPRECEENGKDYWFVDNDTFKEVLDRDLFAEYDEYSQNRLYGTLKTDYMDGNKVVVLTPNGYRQLIKNCPNEKFFTVLVEASLGTRIKRYIDRCGVNNFNFDDKNEICSRVDRDFGMFLGLEKEVDLVVHNDEGTNVEDVVIEIFGHVVDKVGLEEDE